MICNNEDGSPGLMGNNIKINLKKGESVCKCAHNVNPCSHVGFALLAAVLVLNVSPATASVTNAGGFWWIWGLKGRLLARSTVARGLNQRIIHSDNHMSIPVILIDPVLLGLCEFDSSYARDFYNQRFGRLTLQACQQRVPADPLRANSK